MINYIMGIVALLLLFIGVNTYGDVIENNPELATDLPFISFFIEDGSKIMKHLCSENNLTMEGIYCVAGGEDNASHVWDIKCKKNIGIRIYYNPEELIEVKFERQTQDLIDKHCTQVKYKNHKNDANVGLDETGGNDGRD